MKRCIICGNMGDDNSTVCDVCGNPYLDLDDEIREDELILREEPEEAPVQEAEQAADENRQKEEMTKESPAEAEAAAAEPMPEEPEESEPVQTAAETVREAAAAGHRAPEAARRMRSGPQIYGQTDGAGRTGRPEQTVRRTRTAPGRPVQGKDAPLHPAQSKPVNAPNAQNRRSNVPNAQGRRVNAPNGQNRPVNAPNGQGRPVNAPNAQNRPANAPNGQGRPMGAPNAQNRPMNAPNGQNRPMGAPNAQARMFAAQGGRLRAASREMFRSPIFILTALLQTVFLIGSIAAIFMKELNFAQGFRLLTSLELPEMLMGYMDNLVNLMLKLDTDAVAVNLIIRIPDLLMCIGLWMLAAAGRSKKEEMPGTGFVFIRVVVIIGLIKNSILMLALLVLSVALTVSAWVSGVKSMVIGSVVSLVLMIVITMMMIMYYFSYLAMLRTFRSNTAEGESYGTASGYVAVIYVITGLTGIVGLLSGIVNAEISGIVSSVGKIGWMLLFAVWIFRYRGKMKEIEG